MTHSQMTDSLSVDMVGQIHNLDAVRGQLAVAETDVASVLHHAWRRWGVRMAEHLIGVFALVIKDESQKLTYLARDALGVKPLFYRIDQGALCYGWSVPELVSRSSAQPLTKDIDWAAAYLLGLSFSQTDTAYREIKKLPAGHWMTLDARGQAVISRYHHWQDNPPMASRRDPRWVEAYREVLEESIRCRIDPDAPIGTENSGGIDSATITAYLARLLGEPGDRLHSFGFAFAEQEPAYILETSQASNICHNYLITGRQQAVHTAAARGLAAFGYPVEHGNSISHTLFYEECQRRGIRSLHSGFGGDEIVTNQGHHLRFELLDQQQYAGLWNILPGNLLTRALRLIKAVAFQPPRPAYNRSFFRAWNQRWPHQLLRPEVVQRLQLYERYMETAIFDAPFRRINDWVLQYHLQRMQIAARLESCTVVAASYGIDYRWPLFDARLIQQYLSTPGIEKVGPNGMGRYLHRRAIDGVVPHRVAWKPSKDMGYAQLITRANAEGVARLAESVQSLEEGLHPDLEALVDHDKFKQQRAKAKQGAVDDAFGFAFRKSSSALLTLNAWWFSESGA